MLTCMHACCPLWSDDRALPILQKKRKFYHSFRWHEGQLNERGECMPDLPRGEAKIMNFTTTLSHSVKKHKPPVQSRKKQLLPGCKFPPPWTSESLLIGTIAMWSPSTHAFVVKFCYDCTHKGSSIQFKPFHSTSYSNQINNQRIPADGRR